VTVTLWLELELSWARIAACIKLRRHTSINLQVMPPLIFFIFIVLGIKNEMTPIPIE
jgi:hypothetical protein